MAEVSLLRVAAALLLVLGLIGLCALVARRFGGGAMRVGGTAKRLDVLESRLLDNRHRLVLVRCDRQEYLLLTGVSGDLLIDRLPLREDPAHA